jgi:hypothetical protein
MTKKQSEFHLPEGEWRPAGPEGMWELILSEDPETGDYTRLARLEPGTDTTEMGVLTHDFHEEVYIVHGDLTDLSLGRTFHGGMYACRLPGMEHGPYRSRNGCLMVETRYDFQ